jgi:hypothetical protein
MATRAIPFFLFSLFSRGRSIARPAT